MNTEMYLEAMVTYCNSIGNTFDIFFSVKATTIIGTKGKTEASKVRV